MVLEPCPRARQARHTPGQSDEIATEGATGGAVVASQDRGGAIPHGVDRGEPGKAERLSRDDGKKGEDRNGRQRGAHAASQAARLSKSSIRLATPRPVASSRRPA